VLLSGLLALIVSTIALRTIDDYFIICTLGIPGIPNIQFFGIGIESKPAFLLLTLFFATLFFFFLKKLTGSSFGRTLLALSEDEIFAQSLGKNVYLAKVIAFTLSAMLAAVPGTLYAHYISYIDPTSFTVDESIFILSIVIIGGMPNSVAANMRQIIYGAILVFMMFRYRKQT